MKNFHKIVLIIILLFGGTLTHGQNQYGVEQILSGNQDKLRAQNPGRELNNFVGSSHVRKVREKDREALRPHWSIFDFSDTLTFLVRDEFPEYYLGDVDRVDKKNGLCLRHGKGIFRAIEDDGTSFYSLGPWKRDMMHGLVIYRSSGSEEAMVAEYRYDIVKEKTIRLATPEERASLDEAIKKIDDMLASLLLP